MQGGLKAVIDLQVGRTLPAVGSCERAKALPDGYSAWALVLMSRGDNKITDRLARRSFLPIDHSEWETRVPSSEGVE
jgi:hypothetical protein